MIAQYYEADSFLIISFHDSVLQVVHELNPGIKTGILVEKEGNWEEWHSRAKNCHASILATWMVLVTPELVAQAKYNNISLYVWTVNTYEDMLRLARLGVQALITNYADVGLHVKKNITKQLRVRNENLC